MGLLDHAPNRANARLAIFTEDGDCDACERVLTEAVSLHEMRSLDSCPMPHHFRPVLWPRADGDLSRLLLRLTTTPTRRGQAQRLPPAPAHSIRTIPVVPRPGRRASLGR